MVLFRKLRDGIPPDTYIGTNFPHKVVPPPIIVPDAPVEPPKPLDPTVLPNPPAALRCDPYSFTFPDYDFLGTPPIAWSFTELPTCLNGNSMGNLFGTPCASGVYQSTATTIDSKGVAKTFSFEMTVVSTVPQILFPGEY